MTIDDLKKAKIVAMKAHDKVTVTAYDVLINKVMLLSIEKKAAGTQMTEADFMSVIQKTEKELIDERDAFAKANRAEEVANLDKQIAVVRSYLPDVMSDEKMSEILTSLPDKSIGAIMKHFSENYAGQYDKRKLSEMAKNIK